MNKEVYIVATSKKEALDLASVGYGHEKKADAEKHLAEVKAPPTDPYYANQYRIFLVPKTA